MRARDERLAAGLRDVFAQCIEAYLVDPRDTAAKLAALSVAVGVSMATALRALDLLGDDDDVLKRLGLEPIMQMAGARVLSDLEKLQRVRDALLSLLAEINAELRT